MRQLNAPRTRFPTLLALLLACGLTAAEPAPPAPTAPEQVSEADKKAFVLDKAPEGAQTISAVRTAGIEAGKKVIIRAQIAGRNPPWAPGHALMILADDAAISKTRSGGCGAPWDYCSADPKTVLANTCVVRWKKSGSDRPRAVSFLDLAKIAPLSTVVVSGTIVKIPDPNVLMLDLDGFHLEDRGKWGEWMDKQLAAEENE